MSDSNFTHPAFIHAMQSVERDYPSIFDDEPEPQYVAIDGIGAVVFTGLERDAMRFARQNDLVLLVCKDTDQDSGVVFTREAARGKTASI